MKRKTILILALAATWAFATAALAEIEVTITAVVPADGTIGTGDTATIAWKIDGGSESGDYDVVVGGDGTPGTGEAVQDSNGSGTFNGTATGTTSISADADLTEGDGDYVVYVIAVNSADDTDYGSASTTISLDTPPGSVTNVSAGAGDQRVFVTWDPHEDTDIDHYLVYYGNSPGSAGGDYLGSDAAEGSSPVDVGNVTEGVLSGLTNNVRYYMRVTAVDDGGTESPLSAEVGATPSDAQGAADLAGDTEGCFIATAAYGDIDHERVRALRAYRDGALKHTNWGRAFVAAYYRHSPPVARFVAAHPVARAAVRTALAPLAWAAETSASPSRSAWTALLGLAALGFIPVRRRVANRRKGDA